jgi:hypothetical protein
MSEPSGEIETTQGGGSDHDAKFDRLCNAFDSLVERMDRDRDAIFAQLEQMNDHHHKTQTKIVEEFSSAISTLREGQRSIDENQSKILSSQGMFVGVVVIAVALVVSSVKGVLEIIFDVFDIFGR